jgi:hypothetical protein
METFIPQCPTCRKTILSDDVNVAKDIIYCRSCNLAHSLSALLEANKIANGVNFDHPPPGVRYDHASGQFTVSATHRSLGMAAGMLAAALFWNGIVSIFVLIAIAGTLNNMGVTLPTWFPAPDMNGSPMSTGMTIFLWLFLTPFIVIGISMIGTFFLSVGGRTEVKVDAQEGIIFTGVGPLGYRRRFMPSHVSDVRIEDSQWRDSDGDRQQKTNIIIETKEGKLIRFGSMLTSERRRFLAALLRKSLVR